MGDAAFGGVRGRAAEFFEGDVFTGDGFYDVGAGDEHVAGLFDHEDEVGEGGRVDGAAGARPHDGANLGDDAGGERVAQEDVGVAAEADDPFLDACAAGVVDADDGRAVAHRHVHDFDDFFGVDAAEAAAKDGEILAEDVDETAVYGSPSRDDAVAGNFLLVHAKVAFAVHDEGVQFMEGAAIQEQFDSLVGGHLAFGFLLGDAFLAAAGVGLSAQLVEFFDLVHTFLVLERESVIGNW